MPVCFRTFAAPLVLVSVLGLAAVPARAQAPAPIGVAAPLTGPVALLGRQIVAGAQAASGGTPILSADTRCEAEGGAEAARQLRAGGARIVVGFLCAEALEAALPILGEAGIPTIAVGVRADRITDNRARSGALVWRLGPRSDAEAQALARAIRERWGAASFALVDDGGTESRALVDAVRAALESEGRAPAIAVTLRAGAANQSLLAGRLAASGARNVVIAAGPGDAAVLARDAAAAGTPFALIGSESLFDERAAGEAPELPAGTLAVAERGFYPSSDPAAPGADVDPSAAGYRRLATAAVEIANQALRDAGDTAELRDALAAGDFATILGPISFDEKGDSSLDHFGLYEWRDGRFQPTDAAEATR
ncbi:branched-chain amino acid ABC transporter substrate-binding protein [Antarcticirhabdus aurantiaca]|uniref:Branched-chain amino acid ABC transporter substrate-binding protein n=1 Tax=Antarcticirhabdus aurantiaca TaxID=2606717 RepID=A0ACD4NV57_9HYPH|nr:branched-chain amino acid ABC transporter substrate-binding protein [Antarcticirhabdus aurantiaca]WAJ30713.1 branched-chain amino acid ABC transporter substrate-binding protein [Jeongeuplla avenae]